MEKVCKNRPKQQGQQAQVAEHEDEEHLFVASCYLASSSKEAWLVDSGCTNHMTHNASIFKELDKSYYSKVTIGNGETVEVRGKGVVAIEAPTGIKYISDVLYVPEISQSLLSVGQMLEKNYSLKFEERECKIFDPSGSEVMTIKMRDKSFPVEWKQTTMHAFPSASDDNPLWHKRLGHSASVDKEADVCEACQLGKQSSLSFPKNQAWRASQKLELVHSDVCGPMSTPTMNGSRFFCCS